MEPLICQYLWFHRLGLSFVALVVWTRWETHHILIYGAPTLSFSVESFASLGDMLNRGCCAVTGLDLIYG